MNRILVPLLLLFFVGTAQADELILKSGQIHKGTITGATSDSVSILVDGTVVHAAKSDVLVIVFTNSDIVTLSGDRKIQCKVAGKAGNAVVIATPGGTTSVDNSEIMGVQYNSGSEIQVPELPETGRQFTNESGSRVWAGERLANLFARLRLAAHYASLSKWENQFSFSGNQESPSSGFLIGGELGYAFRHILQLGAGYEYFSTREVKIENVSPTFTDGVSYTFLYGNIRAGDFLSSLPRLYLYASAGAGSLKATEKIAYSDGVTVEGSGSSFAFRVGGGAEYFVSGTWSMSTEIDYLAGNVTDVRVLGRGVSGYELDCSGVSILFAVSFHIPLQ